MRTTITLAFILKTTLCFSQTGIQSATKKQTPHEPMTRVPTYSISPYAARMGHLLATEILDYEGMPSAKDDEADVVGKELDREIESFTAFDLRTEGDRRLFAMIGHAKTLADHARFVNYTIWSHTNWGDVTAGTAAAKPELKINANGCADSIKTRLEMHVALKEEACEIDEASMDIESKAAEAYANADLKRRYQADIALDAEQLARANDLVDKNCGKADWMREMCSLGQQQKAEWEANKARDAKKLAELK